MLVAIRCSPPGLPEARKSFRLTWRSTPARECPVQELDQSHNQPGLLVVSALSCSLQFAALRSLLSASLRPWALVFVVTCFVLPELEMMNCWRSCPSLRLLLGSGARGCVHV